MKNLVKKYDDAVSPVVGVMLMLVVTIIVAAVVSSFAGSLVGANAEKTPTLTMDVKIVNTGFFAGSGFFATVTGVSQPILTSDLQLVTAWTARDGTSGGETISAGTNNFFANPSGRVGAGSTSAVRAYPPWGFGSGVSSNENIRRFFEVPAHYFGNYALMPGTSMSAWPAPYTGESIGGMVCARGNNCANPAGFNSGYGIPTLYEYTRDSTSGADYADGHVDAMQAMLGNDWQKLRLGDVVSVSIIHTPSGKTIFRQSVPVSEA
jgi:FlaG/FlaF family flagellin (archaellin)